MHGQSRRDFLAMAGAATGSCLLTGYAGAQTAPKPALEKLNIVFIMVDDTGWADLGCYGSKAIQTPNIDRLAAEGIRFTQAYAGSSVCAPSRSVLMTGLHAGHTSVRANTSGVPLLDEDITVAEVLKKADYACGGFGKWGLGDVRTTGVPEQQGFNEFFGYYHQIHAHDYWTSYLWHNSRKVEMPGEPGTAERYSHYHAQKRTLDFIRQNKDRPFFCYASWTPPHGKLNIPQDDPAWLMYQDKDWTQTEKLVAAMNTMIDRHVGEVLELLKELGLDERTIVFFCSDNGGGASQGVLQSSGPLRGGKRSMYEGGIRVPLIVRWPGHIKPGQVSDHVCYFPDIMPTLAELTGTTKHVPKNIDGLSLVPMLLGRKAEQKTHEYLYWEFHVYDWKRRVHRENGLTQAVRKGKWKMLRNQSDVPFELYDLERDVGEQNNLAEKHPEIVADMEAYIKANRIEPRPQIEPDKPPGMWHR